MDLPDSKRSRWIAYGLATFALLGAVVGAGVLFPAEVSELTDDDTPVEVALQSGGEAVATVEAHPARTREDMITGLGDHESLAPGKGMLFFHGTEGEQTYVMRDMEFAIDMVFIDSSCEITAIHRGEKPGENESGVEAKYHYSGTAKYVLEVPAGYATERVEVGDTVAFDGGC